MDVRVTNHGTIFTFELLTKKALEWVTNRVHAEPHQFLGGTLCVEHRFAWDLAVGMVEDGLEVE